jgi:hypothetical protein
MQRAHRLQSVDCRHHEVHQDHIGRQPSLGRKRLAAVRGLADDLEAAVTLLEREPAQAESQLQRVRQLTRVRAAIGTPRNERMSGCWDGHQPLNRGSA